MNQDGVDPPTEDGATAPSDLDLPPPATRSRLAVGTDVGGWRIEGHIGSGPWSDVYVSIGVLSGVPRRLALKVIQVGSQLEAGESALREAHAVSSFRHPNLMHALAVWQQPMDTEPAGAVVLLLPLAELSLASYLRGVATSRIPPCHVTAIYAGTAGIASALAYLHGSRKADGSGVVVHNDVKPENILQADGAWVLGDLGIASVPGSAGAAARAGSPSYLAPEYVADPPADKQPPGDVWALGVTLHRWLTGRFPFPGDTPPERLGALRAGAPPVLEIADAAVRELVSGMIARQPADRPPAAMVARRLRALSGLRRPPRVRLATAAAGAALIVAGGVGGALGYAGLAPHQQPETVLQFASYGTAKSLTHGQPVPIKAQPRLSARVIGELKDGAPAGIVCTRHSDVVRGNWGRTSLWDRIQVGHVIGWVSDGLLFTGTNAAVAPPCRGG